MLKSEVIFSAEDDRDDRTKSAEAGLYFGIAKAIATSGLPDWRVQHVRCQHLLGGRFSLKSFSLPKFAREKRTNVELDKLQCRSDL